VRQSISAGWSGTAGVVKREKFWSRGTVVFVTTDTD